MKITASLRIMSESLDPQRITDLLGREPDHTHSRGPRGDSSNRHFLEGQWLLDSGLPANAALEHHLEKLLSFCSGRQKALRQLASEGIHADIYVGIFAEDLNVALSINPKLIAAMADVPLSLGIDIYCEG